MKINATNDDAILKSILNGKHKSQYLIYKRKSTDEPDNQKNSLSYQGSEIARHAASMNLPIASVTLPGFCTNGVISEKHSAFKVSQELEIRPDGTVQYRVERPKFHKATMFLNEGYFKGIIAYSWDRLSRNGGDATIIKKLIERGVDVQFVDTTFEKNASGRVHMDVIEAFSEYHSRRTSDGVTVSTRKSRAQGKCTYTAPIGYLNQGTIDHKPLDPLRAPIIKELFELYATEEWSLETLARYANEQGCTSAPRRRKRTKAEILEDEERDQPRERPKTTRPLTKNRISEILKNPFYTGRTLGNDGTFVKSTSHEALVSDELFDRVQFVLGGNNTSVHYTDKLELPMRGMLRCAVCNRVYTPYIKKGICYFYSRCTECCKNERKNRNLEFVEGIIGDLLSTLYFTDEELTSLVGQANGEARELDARREKEAEQTRRKQSRIDAQLSYLDRDRLSLLASGAYSPDAFVEEQERLRGELAEIAEQEAVSDATMQELLAEVINLSELVKNVAAYYNFFETDDRERIARTVFSELFIADNTLDYNVRRGFEPLKTRSVLTCAPKRAFSELCKDRHHIKESIRALRSICSDRSKE